jgi:hypothetical protein
LNCNNGHILEEKWTNLAQYPIKATEAFRISELAVAKKGGGGQSVNFQSMLFMLTSFMLEFDNTVTNSTARYSETVLWPLEWSQWNALLQWSLIEPEKTFLYAVTAKASNCIYITTNLVWGINGLRDPQCIQLLLTVVWTKSRELVTHRINPPILESKMINHFSHWYPLLSLQHWFSL